jgi:hypothetical protein
MVEAAGVRSVRKAVTVSVRRVDVNYDHPGCNWVVSLITRSPIGLSVGAHTDVADAVRHAQELAAANSWSYQPGRKDPARPGEPPGTSGQPYRWCVELPFDPQTSTAPAE